MSSVHFALDTRIFYRECLILSQWYKVSLIAIHPKAEHIQGVDIIPFKRFHSIRWRIILGWLIMFFKALKVNAKVYHFHDPELIPTGLLLKCLGKKVIFDIHENIAEDLFDKPWIKQPKRIYRLFAVFESLACKLFSIILAENSYEKRYAQKAKRWATVLNYCDTDFFKPYKKTVYQHQLNLFYSGIVLENRGMLQVAEAVYLLQEEGYDAHFHCVGELYSDLNNKLEALPYWSKINSKMHFYGRLPLEQSYAMAPQMDIGLCVIWPMSNSIESLPTKWFEYMACGLPIITSDFPFYQQMMQKSGAGICINPKDALALKNAILELHLDVKKTELMVENGQNAVLNNYQWNSQIPLLAKVYTEALG